MAALREILVAFGITVDTAPLKKGEAAADRLKDKFAQFGASIAAYFALDAVKDFVMGTVAAADAVGDQAARLNISTRALEEWTYAAKFADIQAGELDGIFNKLARSSVEAGDATSEQGKTLKKLGVDVKDANGNFKDTGTLFEEVGLALGGMSDATERTALSMQFFGKTAGPKVLQLFKEGPEGIRKFREEFEALGGGMGDFVDQAGAIDDQMHRLDLAWVSTKVKIVGVVLPAVSLFITGMTKASSFVSKLAKETNILQTILGAFAAFAIAKASMLAVAYWPVVAPFLAWAAAMAGLVLVGEDLVTFFQGGDSVIGRAIEKWFGPGSAQKVRDWAAAVVDAFSGFVSGVFADALSTVKGILDLIGLALGSNSTAVDEWGSKFLVHTNAISDAIDGLISKLRDLQGLQMPTEASGTDPAEHTDSWVSRVGKKIFGDPLEGEGAKADAAHNARVLAKLRAERNLAAPQSSSVNASSAGTVINAPVNMSINVPPGTPAQVVRAAGEAGARGGAKGVNRAAAAAFKGKT